MKNDRHFSLAKIPLKKYNFFVSVFKNDKWHELEEGKKYEFKVEEGNTGSNLLTEFTILEDNFLI